ncbi:MAG: hypothetical protein IJI12_06845 [Atopobiaceae bacterium]|nr:hypothetical protein [Atopobiaceae bacterium]
MDLLTQVGSSGAVQLTQLSHKITIDGQSRAYPVYRIRLDQLHYNHQNDRIATWISQYRAEHNGQLPDETDLDAYNDIIEDFITKSNPEAIRKTANNIKLFDQRVPGVVLANGLIIDGNRRFTCLRRLAREDQRFNWIEAVILPTKVADDPKRIKLLELAIQHGEEGKVNYDPIDRLVGVYNDIIHDRLLTVEEYARSTNTSTREVQKMVEQANYMVEFLEFINAPGQFHLARELNLAGPLGEIPGIMRNCADEDEEETVRQIVYANIAVEPAGDPTRFVRRFKKILKSPVAKEFVEEETEIAAQVAERLEQVPVVSTDTIRDEIRADKELTNSFANTMNTNDTKAKGIKLRSAPIDNMVQASELLDGVETEFFEHLSPEDHSRAAKVLDEIVARVDGIRALLASGDSREA